MIRWTLCVLAACLMSEPIRAEPKPLTDEQKTKISKVANETKQEADRLKALLDSKQQDLASVYTLYKLDEERATKLETEILDLQREMLANHRKMQVEIRALVGEETFVQLRKRLELMLKSPPKPVQK
jgi:hypothetical protein